MPRLVAASISITSTALPARISVQLSQTSQGSAVGRFSEPIGVAAVERHGQDARDGRLADAAVAGEDVAVRDAVLGQRVHQGHGDVVLADDVGEALRAVFAG
jgi:ribulose-5-phosphate 4-epimerase/fuculose-1-phosphate aldolase